MIDNKSIIFHAGSFYYALVVLTLIGYGHSTPNTVFGKMFTMGYASLGIPAAMIMFQSMGERMNKVFSVIIKKVKTFWGCSRTEVSTNCKQMATLVTKNVYVKVSQKLQKK